MRCKGVAIRTYCLHPDRRVIDHRTGIATADLRAVLNGDLDPFILALLRQEIERGEHCNEPKSNT